MGTFMIPGKAFEGITAIGAPAPEAGFYEASITEVILDPKNAQKPSNTVNGMENH